MNKKIITSVALILSAACAFAQDSYTVKMNMKIEGLPPEYAGLGEQEMVNYIKGDKYKSEMTSMMGSNVTSFDGKKLTSISEAMGEKSGYTATKEELEAANKSDKTEAKPKIEYTSEKKTIAGYECTKAIVTTTAGKDKKEEKVNVWVTDKIKTPPHKNKGRGMSMDFGDLKGYPLEIEMNSNQGGMEMKILITTSEVSSGNIDDSAFNVNTDGYKMISYKENQEKIKTQMSKGTH
jgi:hypothetical protein